MEKKNKIRIGIWGFGHMGQAIFRLLKSRPGLNFFVYSLGVKKISGATVLNSAEELVENCDYVFLCLKPQDFYKLEPLKANRKIFISIMAGVKISNIKKIVGSQKIIRLMPNLPLQVGAGVIGWLAEEKKFSGGRINFIKKLFSSFGYSFRVKNEIDLDKITALSGSGPAYVYLFMAALIRTAMAIGFSRGQSEKIVYELLTGSLKFYNQAGNSPEELVNMVKSKKGTTEAALKKLNTAKFYKSWRAAVNRAYRRAKQLSAYEIK